MADKLPFATGMQAVAYWGRTTPDAVAVVEGESSYSYRTLLGDIARAAEMLRSNGLRGGLVLGIQCEVHYRHLVLILASEVIGAAHLSMAPADLMFDSDLADRCDLLLAEANTEIVSKHPRVICLSRSTLGEPPEIRLDAEADRSPDEVVRISTTSGTTGRRKFVGHTRRSLQHIVASIHHTLRGDTKRYNYVSMYGFNQWGTYGKAVLALSYGKLIAYCTANDFRPTIRRLGFCHTMLLVGDAVRFVVQAPRDGRRSDDCTLRVIAAALSPRLRAELRACLTNDVINAYASNEATDISLIDEDGTGTLYPGVSVKIVDGSGREMRHGEPGIITVRSPCLSVGYLWNEEETSRHFIDGWFRSSDIGVMPEPGKLIVLGRSDDMLNIGGIKVAPYPIEERIRSIDGATDAALVSHTNQFGADELHVVIECPDPAAHALINARLPAILDGHVSQITIHFANELPRTNSGKIKRAVLRDHLQRKSGG